MIWDAFSLSLAPLVDWRLVAALGALTLVLLGWGLSRRASGIWWRALMLGLVLAALANPSLIAERRDPKPDVAVLAIDESQSQKIGERSKRRDEAIESLRKTLAGYRDLEVREVKVHGAKAGRRAASDEGGTRMMTTLAEALADVPKRRLAGVVAVTDGQVHDVADAIARGGLPAPFHVLLTGERGEADRRLTVDRVPAFGMVGKTVRVDVTVRDEAAVDNEPVAIEIRRDGKPLRVVQVPVNTEQGIDVLLEHGGQTVIELLATPGPRELTTVNNRAVIAVNGVRDRLRVLLVSGSPHAGERTWRDLLKADPSVDLVHFTILRPPEKQDGTPIRELSLIAFPIRELFELKLEEFDLIIFDRYRRRGVLPRAYLNNIVEYVRNGGALLEASGPTFATRLSLARTPLGQILPAAPTGMVVERGYRPRLTEIGRRHPVTADLLGAGDADNEPGWGRWFRQIDALPERGATVMTGVEGRPLVILDRVGKGRVAHILSDHMWLWSRGYEGGGPQAEMLRRTSHWLMREPELEENDLKANVSGNMIEIIRRSLEESFEDITITLPDDSEVVVTPIPDGPGRASVTYESDQLGLHRLSDGDLDRLVAVGALNPVEFADVRTTAAVLSEVTSATGGGVHWLSDGGVPGVRRVREGRNAAGHDWVGLVANGDYVVTGLRTVPLLPGLVLLLLVSTVAMVTWRREGN